MKTVDSVRDHIPANLRDNYFIDPDKFNDLSWAEDNENCYVCYLTAYQGQRDKLYIIPLNVWFDLIQEHGGRNNAMKYVFEWFEPDFVSHRIF